MFVSESAWLTQEREIRMPDPRTMFNREVDFSLEDTENSYAACRALSLRAREINSRFRNIPEGTEIDTPNPTVGALNDYSDGRIVVNEEEAEQAAEPPSAPEG